jgi:hypothetical protein
MLALNSLFAALAALVKTDKEATEVLAVMVEYFAKQDMTGKTIDQAINLMPYHYGTDEDGNPTQVREDWVCYLLRRFQNQMPKEIRDKLLKLLTNDMYQFMVWKETNTLTVSEKSSLEAVWRKKLPTVDKEHPV